MCCAVLCCAVLCCAVLFRSRNQMKQACLAAATYKVIVDALPVSVFTSAVTQSGTSSVKQA
jgi:hypothetical protein